MEKITKKRKREGGYINTRHVDRGKPGIRSDGTQTSNSPSKPRRTHEDSVWQVRMAPIWRRGSLPALFQTGFTQKRVSEFYLLVCLWCTERERGKLDDNAVMPMFWKPPPQEG